MCGATVATVAIGVGTSLATHAITSAIGGSPSGGSAGGGGGGDGSGGLSVSQLQYAYHGPHPGTTPMSGKEAPAPKEMSAQKPVQAQAANPRSTPTQGVGTGIAKQDYNNVWANRLSRYLDYNTRNLG